MVTAGSVEVCQDLSNGETYMDKWNGSTGNKEGYGVAITDTGEGSEFIGLEVDTVKVWLKKSVGAPDVSFSVGMYRGASKGTELYNFTNGNLSGVTTSMVQYEFTGSSGTHTIATGDIVAIMFPNNGSRLYTKVYNGGGLTGLVASLFGEWDASPHDYWTYQSSNSFTFCVS